ncbi:hypothetical protein B0I26_10819 [Anoxybacillus vitaminiphilus]|uniref:Uncharacterized protein n=1 Tax=Paranoxybacillus vitaminiphilus TaxID=581036 RepID=A0A327YD97_9BACL|nr:hypothetical protein [Anoxybacillus vitaminiphilus]RAK18844.1 hypothetical protein B0I26_10819 [Anoxybacillus vitaminiphilus]
MKQYLFSFETDHPKRLTWKETILAGGMMEAFLKAKQLVKQYAQEKGGLIRVEYIGVRYLNN